MTRRSHWPWYGFGFGCLLFVFAFGSAGAGHGSYLPFAIFAAPASLIPVIGLFAAPAWWSTVGWLLKQQRPRLSGIAMAVHSASVGIVLWLGTPTEPGREQWRYFRNAEQAIPVWLWSGLALYALGLVTSWLLIARPNQAGRKPAPDGGTALN